MNRLRPKAVASRAHAAVQAQRDLDWKAMAAAWSLAHSAGADIEDALRSAISVAHSGLTRDAYPWADAAVAAVARRHGVTVDALVYGGREFAGVRFEAFFLLSLRSMPDHAIARLFHLKVLAVKRGRQTFKRELASSAELRAQVGWLVNELDKRKAAV